MTIRLIRRVAVFASALAVGAVLAIAPAPGICADPQPADQATTPQHATAHIKSLHDKLRITPAQEPQWDAVAQIMATNAKTMHDLVEERAKNLTTMSAIDDLQSYQAIADAHAAGVRALLPAFQTLYATMDDAQKKNADAVFRHRPRVK